MNREQRRANGIRDLPRPANVPDLRPRDPRLERVKFVAVGVPFLVQIMSQPGAWVREFQGWPEGAEVVGVNFDPTTGNVMIALYRPDFPVALAGVPPTMIQIKAAWMQVDAETAPLSPELVDELLAAFERVKAPQQEEAGE